MEEQNIEETPIVAPPLPLKNRKRPLFIVLSLLVILAGAVFAGIQIGKKQIPKTPSEILFNQPIIQATPTTNQTEGWKTYTNEKMKFSMKYPPVWFAHKETLYPIAEGRTSERYEAVFSFPVDNPSPQDFIEGQKAVINITYTPKPKGSFASYIDKLMSQDWGATPYQSETLVADIKATVIGIGDPPKNKYVFFDKNGWYFIGLNVEKNETYETYSQLFDQILATFKFLDSKPVSDLDKAREALKTYFSLLSDGMYIEAIKYNGNGWGVLRDWNPSVDPNDYAKLLEKGCRDNGYKCLKIKTILKEGLVSPPGFYFVVQFSNPDGTLFKRGPCCGATEETMPTQTDFEFRVRKEGNQFLVITQPVYVP